MSVAWPTVRALCVEMAVCIGVIALAVAFWSPLTALLAIAVLGTRQHALFILYHDAVHGLIAKPLRLNDLVINLFVGVPMLLPVHMYRSLHMVHHRRLGSETDPERAFLYVGQDWDYRPLPMRRLIRQLLGDTLLYNQLKTAGAYYKELLWDRRLGLPKNRWWPELVVLQALFWGAVAALAWTRPELAWKVGLLWFGAFFTVLQGIQKVRSFAEHDALGADELSYSWEPGLLGRLTVWPYHIQYHREHHAKPSVPWFRLPEAFPDRDARPGRELPQLLWDGTW